MRLFYAASEVAGFAKTGGLADVAASLPRALAARGHECAIVMPLYSCVRAGHHSLTNTGLTFGIPLGNRMVAGGLWHAKLPDADVSVYFIEQPAYFERDDDAKGAGIYQHTRPDGTREDYIDNCQRFVFFNQAILETLRVLNWWPDVVHVNDWQTALVPVYLKELYPRYPEAALRPRFASLKTLLTIHNLAYQGLFWHLDMPITGLPWRLFDHEHLEYFGKINFLKGGIVYADLLTTVSPTYAQEIQTPYYGCGLQAVLAARRNELFGIVNGIDEQVWSPKIDHYIDKNYDATNVLEGKAVCKKSLQAQFGLKESPATPLLACVSRLAEQKGIDLLCQITPALLQKDVQLVVLGEGQHQYHSMLESLRSRFPSQMGLKLGQDEALAHRIEAGADMFLMPSLYEPCGLSQLYSLKYGTVPIVRATGGLADTVTNVSVESAVDGSATGFSFVPRTAEAFLKTIEQALVMYHRRPDDWLKVMRTGMSQDWSWRRSAAEYEKLYEKLAIKK